MAKIKVNQLAEHLKEINRNATKKFAEEVLTEANKLTPIKSGFLVSRNQLIEDEKGFILKNDAPYAPFVYFGSATKQGARWFERAVQLVAGRR